MIAKALFTFECDEGEEYKKEELYEDEIENMRMLEERAMAWIREEEFTAGKRTHRDYVFGEHSRLLTFEYGLLFIEQWSD